MRVLLVHNFYRTPGGEDAVVRQERDLLSSKGVEVYEYFRDSREIDSFSLAARAAVPVNALGSRSTFAELSAILRDVRFDVACVHNIYPLISPSALDALVRSGLPVLQFVHNYRYLCPNGTLRSRKQTHADCNRRWTTCTIRRCYRGNAVLTAVYSAAISRARQLARAANFHFVCLSRATATMMRDSGVAQSTFVRPNFLDCADVAPQFEPGTYAAYLGRLSMEKGIWSLVKAFEAMPHRRLRVAGAGPEERHLRRYVSERGLKHINFEGPLHGDAKWNFLRNSAYVVVPSECEETFGMVVLEAFAAGKPVVASRCGALPEVVAENTGRLFASGDVSELKVIAEQMFISPELTNMGRQGRKRVEQHFSPEAAHRRFVEIAEMVQTNVQ